MVFDDKKVHREVPKAGAKKMFSDIEIEFETELFLFELKNLSTIYFNECKGITDWEKLTKWDNEVLAQRTDKEILEMQGSFFVNGVLQKNTPVSKIMEEAESQLIGYMEATHTQKANKSIYGYVLIRVGLKRIIHKKFEKFNFSD